MKYTHNSDPELYINHRVETNCGSFALNLCEWYEPDIDTYDCGDYIYEMLLMWANEGATPYDIANDYIEQVYECIADEFDIEYAEYAFGEPVALEGKELIALRGYCDFDEDDPWDIDWDFHFRVYRDGMWQEKNGCQAVHKCDINDWGKYNSDTIYFYHTIGA